LAKLPGELARVAKADQRAERFACSPLPVAVEDDAAPVGAAGKSVKTPSAACSTLASAEAEPAWPAVDCASSCSAGLVSSSTACTSVPEPTGPGPPPTGAKSAVWLMYPGVLALARFSEVASRPVCEASMPDRAISRAWMLMPSPVIAAGLGSRGEGALLGRTLGTNQGRSGHLRSRPGGRRSRRRPLAPSRRHALASCGTPARHAAARCSTNMTLPRQSPPHGFPRCR